MSLQKKISRKKYQAMVGHEVEVLVERCDGPRGNLRGRLRTQAPEIDGSVYLKGEARPGDFVQARITKALPYDLIGRVERSLT